MGFVFRDGFLYCGSVSVEEIAKEKGTPFFLYSFDAISDSINKLENALNPDLIAFAVKSNPTLPLLQYINRLGCGFDVGSYGELMLVKKVSDDYHKILFTGLGKTDECLDEVVSKGIGFIGIDDPKELKKLHEKCVKYNSKVKVLLRLNPDIDAKTHEYITTGLYNTKFGMDEDGFAVSMNVIEESERLEFKGIHIHIGSLIGALGPYVKMVDFALDLHSKYNFEYVDLGGGFPIQFDSSPVTDVKDISGQYHRLKDAGLKIIIEPGRFIVGNAGILVTRAILDKKIGKKNYLVCDTGMNSLIRPPLYNAKHHVVPLSVNKEINGSPFDVSFAVGKQYDVVGPCCENTDFISRDIMLDNIKEGSLLAIFSAGAYGYAMSCNYNGYPRAAQYGVKDDSVLQLTKSQNIDDICRNDLLL